MPEKDNVYDEKFRSRKELAYLLGLSHTTFWRRLKALGIKLKNGLISPEEQQDIAHQLRQPRARRFEACAGGLFLFGQYCRANVSARQVFDCALTFFFTTARGTEMSRAGFFIFLT